MGVWCPYCGAEAVLTDSASIYSGRSYGWMWACRPCDAYVGCHKGTTQPLGRLADAELRRWKIKAHKAFDPIWKKCGVKRKKAYDWLAGELRIHPSKCHIGMFDINQCQRTEKLCKEYLKAHAQNEEHLTEADWQTWMRL